MKFYNLYLSEVQLKELKQLSKTKDISVSELIRRAIDEYLEKR